MIEHLTTYYYCDIALLSEPPSVMQVGAFSPRTAQILAERFPGAKIAVVEADDRNYTSLTATPLPDGVEAVQAALAASDGPVTLHRFANRGANSLWPLHWQGGGRLVAEQPVQGMRLASLLDRCGFGALDLLLCNCEGAELFALLDITSQPSLAERLGQACIATHWRHCRVYEEAKIDRLLDAASPAFHITREVQRDLEYVLLRRKGSA